ncbi:transmembrane protein 145 isoform X2 [Cimex lectularius]|uniref:GPR180/TMEM145 transmembrane domain-containing protein n=1 Tax=Cimex lectularius TaxID=79782 RepID=A0A8I6TKE6_CIMLE|nr:transmembrane protein 145 isoform X2 [Cimex lectularius]
MYVLWPRPAKTAILAIGLLIAVHEAAATHLQGTWNSEDFFLFLSKFGVQKTDLHYEKDTLGYIYGNVTTRSNSSHTVTLAVLDRTYFLEYYGNRTLIDKEAACKRMFDKIGHVAYDSCYEDGIDLLRRVPCPEGELCPDEDTPWNVVKHSQFTFAVKDLSEPRFWYVSLVACYRNTSTCEWHHMAHSLEINYDIWLVNGNPNTSTYNPLVYQFSFDRQNTVELYLVFFMVYFVLVPLQLYAVVRQRHPVTRLFTASLLLEFLGLCFNLVDVIKFTMDGVGYPNIAVVGDILDILSRTTFMLLLLLLAKGWAVTRQEFTWKPLLFTVWFIYGVVHVLLYVWNKTEVDIIEDIDEYQTWPGWLILGLRCLIIVWFLLELRATMRYEHNDSKLHFFLHFGASALVWYIYLPIIALVALQIPPFWRYKLLLGITYSADCLAYIVMTQLLWPTRTEQYFLLATHRLDATEELDEFNEAPHVIHGSGNDRLIAWEQPDPKEKRMLNRSQNRVLRALLSTRFLPSIRSQHFIN